MNRFPNFRLAGILCATVALSVGQVHAQSVSSPTLFDFEGSINLAQRLKEQGGKAQLIPSGTGKALRVEFGIDAGNWPGVYLTPAAGRWDLSKFTSVQMDVTNQSESEVRLMCRVDNPNATGNERSNTDGLTLKPGEQKTLRVVFGKSWGGVGAQIDRSNITGLMIFADQPKGPVVVTVDNIRAAGSFATLPAWLGKRPPVPGKWKQTLNEDFNGNTLSARLWMPRLVWNGPLDFESQVYSHKNVRVENGALRIRCEKRRAHLYEDPKLPERDYVTGAVTSFDKFTQKYGYFEARVKFPRARGLWPAFWMMPDRGRAFGDTYKRRDTGLGDGMEIDIAEHLTEWGEGQHNVAVHWDGYGKEHKSWGTSDIFYPPTSDGYHVVGLLWEPGKLTWFTDGKETQTWSNPRVGSTPMYLKFTVQMGGWATKNVDDAALPQDYVIDYVRVWQRTDAPPKPIVKK